MKIRSLIVATLVLLGLVGTLYWSQHRKTGDETPKAAADVGPEILKLDPAAITKLELKKKDEEPIILAQNASGAWQITQPKEFPADTNIVSSALTTLSLLTSERLVENKATDLKQYGLDQPALEVDITEKNHQSQRLLLGDATPTGSAVYAMVAGSPRIFTLASYRKMTIDRGLNDLRDKRLLTMDTDKISSIDFFRKGEEIEFGRTKDGWQILKPKPLRADGGEIDELTRKLANVRMQLSETESDDKAEAAAFAHATPVATVKVIGPSATQELQVRKDGATYYAKSSLIDGEYKTDSSLGQELEKGLDDFRNKQLFDFGNSDLDKIEMRDGSKAWFLSRTGADWWWNGKKMDPASVEDLISKLRDLSASKFAEAGFASSTIEITIGSDNGKHTEKVSIAKSGDNYLGKRENDATLYQLAPNSVDGLQKAAEAIKPAGTPSK
jgi:Domain of unknown function (DUF4340)